MENLNEKFDELSNYFKQKIVKGNYDIINVDEKGWVVKIIMDNKYIFHLWASRNSYQFFHLYLYDGENAMFFDFTEDEKREAHQNVKLKLEKL